MVNPGAFQGSRRDFLEAQMALYAAAVTENHVADTVADIQRRYFKRYPISLPHKEEPTAEWLAQVDDNVPDDKLLPPDENSLDEEAYIAAMANYEAQVATLKFRREQIARRLSYQHTKAQGSTKRAEIGSEDPMVVLLAKLAGIPLKKPRMRNAWNVWGQSNRPLIDPIYNQEVKDNNVPPNKRAALRARIIKECFEKLGDDERKEYEVKAAQEHQDAVAKVEQALNDPPSESPNDRQRILGGLPSFIQPILDLITSHTGWKATLLVGGPEPADQGRLNVMSFHSGETSGNVKMNFGRSERRGYKEYVMPIFGNFLKKCYTVEDCRAAALSDLTSMSLAEVLRVGDNEDFDLDSAEGAVNSIRTARTPSGGRDGSVPSTPLPTTHEPPTKVGQSIRLQQVRALSRPPSALATSTTNARLNVESPLQRAPVISIAPSPAPTRALHVSRNVLSTPAVKSPTNLETPLNLEMPAQHVPTASLGGNLPESCPPSPNLSVAPSCAPTPRGSPAPRELPTQAPEASTIPCASPARAFPLTLRAPSDPTFPLPSACLPPTPARQTSPTPTVISLRAMPAKASQGADTRKRRGSVIDTVEESTGSNVGAPKKRLRSSRATVLPAPTSAATDRPVTKRTQPTPDTHAANFVKPAASLPPAELAGCPEWFLKAYQMLISQDLGPEWTQLVRAWAHFERAERYEENGKLGTDGRPACIAAWIARARSATYKPNLGKLSLFEKAFNTWWVGLQPEWRVEGGKILHTQAGDLDDLRRPGKNGLLSVLAALFFWGVAAEQGGIEARQPWKSTIGDVHWVIISLSPK